MKIHAYNNFFSLLAKDRHLLVYDDGVLLKEHRDVLDTFASYRYNNINENTLTTISRMLLTSKTDIVLIYTENPSYIFDICTEVRRFDRTIVLSVVMQNQKSDICKKIINMADSVLATPFETDDLYKKLSAALALKLMIYEMSHTLNTHKKFLNDTGLETYLDSYEQDIRIILERLSGLIERLQSGELGEELFCDLAKEIDIIGTIFTYHHYTSHLCSIFDEMSAFLRMYDFEDVDLSTLEGFDYLVEITKDIHNYLESFFIKRIFSDVYVFEHSLHDSILFMIRRLTKSQNTKSDVEFF